jgi:hypothetical protein
VSEPVEIILRIVAIVGGSIAALATAMSAIKAFVVPRPLSPIISRVVFVVMSRVIELFIPRNATYEKRDDVLAKQAPVSLLVLPLVWLIILIASFTAIQWGVGVELREAFLISGSSMFTLGVRFADTLPSAFASFTQAAIGLLFTALVISYLPSIYGGYGRRETLVGLLEHRAGTPPSPTEVLVRYSRIGLLNELPEDLFTRWEEWFVDIEESHTSIASLVFFRSPYAHRSWVTSAGCVLDTAAIFWSVVDVPRSGRTALLLRSGFMSLHRIADYFRIPYPVDPTAETDEISVSRREFDLMCVELQAAGVPLKVDRDRAWIDFKGWRVNYDAALIGLAAMTQAPPARWSSDRDNLPNYRPRIFRRSARKIRG